MIDMIDMIDGGVLVKIVSFNSSLDERKKVISLIR
jgi:hypothetical protein